MKITKPYIVNNCHILPSQPVLKKQQQKIKLQNIDDLEMQFLKDFKLNIFLQENK